MDANTQGRAFLDALFSDDYTPPERRESTPDPVPTPCPCRGRGCDLCVDERRTQLAHGAVWWTHREQRDERRKYGADYTEPRLDEGS